MSLQEYSGTIAANGNRMNYCTSVSMATASSFVRKRCPGAHRFMIAQVVHTAVGKF